MVMSLNVDYAGEIIFGDNFSIKEGDAVKRTKKFIEVITVWDEFLWLVVNALISPIDNEVAIKSNKFHKIEKNATRICDNRNKH